jgi:hypothetical protein
MSLTRLAFAADLTSVYDTRIKKKKRIIYSGTQKRFFVREEFTHRVVIIHDRNDFTHANVHTLKMVKPKINKINYFRTKRGMLDRRSQRTTVKYSVSTALAHKTFGCGLLQCKST